MDIQKLVNAMSESSQRKRSNYHATFGDLIDKLKSADESCKLFPEIVGIGAYRGYYSDIALCTVDKGITNCYKDDDEFNLPYNSENYDKWDKEHRVSGELPKNPKELAVLLESLLGCFFDGYKGGKNKITREKPLWVASDYGDCSDVAVIGIGDDLKLITKTIE